MGGVRIRGGLEVGARLRGKSDLNSWPGVVFFIYFPAGRAPVISHCSGILNFSLNGNDVVSRGRREQEKRRGEGL